MSNSTPQEYMSQRIWERLTAKEQRFLIWHRKGTFGLTVETPLEGLAVHISQKGHFPSYEAAETTAVEHGAGEFSKLPDEEWFYAGLGPKERWEATTA